MIPLSVPEEDRRIVLRSFWFLISAILAMVVFFLAWMIHLPAGALGLGTFAVVGSLAFANEHLVRRLYHAWNNRIIRPLSNVVSSMILRICLFLIFTATGRAGSRLKFRADGASMWIDRDTEKDHTTTLPFAGHRGAAPNGWMRNYLRWAVHSNNAWAIFLIPFFCMLRMVSIEEPTSSGENIYTLF
jgi:hypothetical protein